MSCKKYCITSNKKLRKLKLSQKISIVFAIGWFDSAAGRKRKTKKKSTLSRAIRRTYGWQVYSLSYCIFLIKF